MQHLIYKENTDEFLLKPLVFKWTWDAEKLFPNYGSQAFQDAITAMEPKEGCSYNAKIALTTSTLFWHCMAAL